MPSKPPLEPSSVTSPIFGAMRAVVASAGEVQVLTADTFQALMEPA